MYPIPTDMVPYQKKKINIKKHVSQECTLYRVRLADPIGIYASLDAE